MKSRGRSQPKVVTQETEEYEDYNGTVFKHYDNKFFDVDSMAEGPKPCTVPVPEIQELQQYVTNCYNSLYKDYNAFKSSVTNQLLSLQEEVQTLSFHNNGRNDDVFPEAVKESPSQYGLEAIQGRTDKLSQWHSKTRVEDYEECEKTAQCYHNARLHPCPDGRSPASREEQHLGKRPSYQTEEDLIQHIPASAWSTKVTNQAGAQFLNAPERGQEATYLSRHLHGSSSPNTAHELQQQSKSWGRQTRPGWSPEMKNELLSTSTAWQEQEQEQADVECKDYDETEYEIEQAIEKIVPEYCTLQSNGINGVRDKDQGFSHGQAKATGVGKDRFTLHGWAASFLQQPTDVRLPKVNKQYIKQEIHRLNDKGRTSKLVACEATLNCELQMEQSVAEMEITSKRPGVTLGEGSLSRSNSQDLKQVHNMSLVNLNSSKPSAGDREKRETTDLNQQNSDNKFPGKKSRGGIAWTVDDLADQNKQRAVM